jgi:hypothetical protein
MCNAITHIRAAVELLAESKVAISYDDLNFVVHWLFDDFPPDEWIDELRLRFSEDIVIDILRLQAGLDAVLTSMESKFSPAEAFRAEYVKILVARPDWIELTSLASQICTRIS